MTGGGNTITTTTGTALTVTNTTIGAGGLWFHSISSNGAPNGIVLTNTGAQRRLTVTGAGTAGTGGTIQNSTQRGARFVSANNISLSWMNFTGNGTANVTPAALCGDALAGTNDNCAAGIDLQSVNGVSLTGVHVSGGAQIGINGKNVTGLTLTGVEVNNAGNEAKEDGIQIHNLFGVAAWAGLNAHDNAAAQVEIQNAGSAPVNLTMTSPQLTAAGFQSSVTGAQGLLFSGSGSADMTLSVTNATFARSFAAAFQADVTGERDRHCRARWRNDERRRKLPEDRQHEQREPDVLDDGIHRVGRSGATRAPYRSRCSKGAEPARSPVSSRATRSAIPG